jgi:hypothetical protein
MGAVLSRTSVVNEASVTVIEWDWVILARCPFRW